MTHARIPSPWNETVLQYAPGSPEREGLLRELERLGGGGAARIVGVDRDDRRRSVDVERLDVLHAELREHGWSATP